MRVPTRSTSEVVTAQLQKLGAQQARLQKQVATNQRIFLPSDDSAAMGRMLNLGAEQSRIAQHQTNIGVARHLAEASFAGLDALSDLSARAGELATLGVGAPGADASRAYGAEVNQLLEQAVQLGNTRFGADYLFAGTALDTEPFAISRDGSGRIVEATYVGNLESAAVSLSETAAVAPRTSGETNLGIRDFIRQLVALRDALDTHDSGAASDAGAGIETATDALFGAISENGAIQLRLDIADSQRDARADSLEKLASSEADVDLASTVVRLSQTTTSYEAALASASKIMNLSLLDYLR